MATTGPRRRQRYVAVTLVALLVAGAGLISVRRSGAEDTLRPCPVIVVLNGEEPRTTEAARLYREGFGREIWLTADPASSDADGDLGVRRNRRWLKEQHVPATVIHILPGAARGTRAELSIVAAELRRRGFADVILVTSRTHVARVKATWWWRVGEPPRAIVRHPLGADDTGWTVREITKTLLALAGLTR